MSAPKIMQMICATAEAIGGQITPAAAALMANDLSAYSIQDIGLALAEVRRTARGRLVVGDILRVLSAADGRPARDEAWAIALNSTDEDETVVTTDEIQLALAAARPVLEAGDKVGARMAFMSAYDRFIEEARRDGAPVNWLVSLGYDAGRRDIAIQKAAQLKRLPADKAKLYLSQEVSQKPTNDGLAIAGLITGNSPKGKVSDNVRAKLAELRESLINGPDGAKAKAAAMERKQRAELNARADQALGIGDGAKRNADHD